MAANPEKNGIIEYKLLLPVSRQKVFLTETIVLLVVVIVVMLPYTLLYIVSEEAKVELGEFKYPILINHLAYLLCMLSVGRWLFLKYVGSINFWQSVVFIIFVHIVIFCGAWIFMFPDNAGYLPFIICSVGSVLFYFVGLQCYSQAEAGIAGPMHKTSDTATIANKKRSRIAPLPRFFIYQTWLRWRYLPSYMIVPSWIIVWAFTPISSDRLWLLNLAISMALAYVLIPGTWKGSAIESTLPIRKKLLCRGLILPGFLFMIFVTLVILSIGTSQLSKAIHVNTNHDSLESKSAAQVMISNNLFVEFPYQRIKPEEIQLERNHKFKLRSYYNPTGAYKVFTSLTPNASMRLETASWSIANDRQSSACKKNFIIRGLLIFLAFLMGLYLRILAPVDQHHVRLNWQRTGSVILMILVGVFLLLPDSWVNRDEFMMIFHRFTIEYFTSIAIVLILLMVGMWFKIEGAFENAEFGDLNYTAWQSPQALSQS